MKKWFNRTAAVLVTVALLACLAPSGAAGAVLKNKQTGQEIRGTLTKQMISGLTIFDLESGGKKFIKLQDWDITEAGPGPSSGHKPASSSRPSRRKVHIYEIPIEGAIMNKYLPAGVARAVQEAKKFRAEYIVFRVDSPGGRVDLANRIIDIVQNIEWAKTVAWVNGKEKRALSAASYICLSTEKIYMAPGTSIGATVPYRKTSSGSAEVDRKFQSAFRAKFRALAEKRNHPPLLAEAMVDSSVSVVQVFVAGRQQLVSDDEAKRLAGLHSGDGKFKRGKTVAKRNEVLCLSTKQAAEYGLIAGVAANYDELTKAMGIENYRLKVADWLTDWTKKQEKIMNERFTKLKVLYTRNLAMSQENDPQRQSYMVSESSGNFTVASQKKWRQYTDLSLRNLKLCYKALDEIEKMQKSGNSPVAINVDWIQSQKIRLDTLYKRMQSERNRKAR